VVDSRHRTTVEIDVDDRSIRQLGTELSRALDPRSVDAFERAIERSGRALSRFVAESQKLTATMTQMARQQAQMARGGGPGGVGGGAGAGAGGQHRMLRNMLGTAAGTFMGNQLSRVGMAGQAGVSGQFIGSALGMIPYAGPVLGAAVNAGNAYYQRFLSVERARLQAGALSGVGRSLQQAGGGMFGPLGMGPSEQPGAIQALAQGTGRTGAADLAAVAPAALSNQRFFGVTAPQRMLRAAESQRQMQGLLGQPELPGNAPGTSQIDAMASAFAAGLRMTDMEEVLGNLATFLQNVGDRGIQVDLSSVMGLMRGMGALGVTTGRPGLGGRSGANFGQQFMGGMAGASQGNDLFSFLMLRHAGLGRGRDLMEAQAFLEDPSNAIDILFDLLGDVQQGRGNLSNNAVAYGLQEGFGQRGINMSSQFWMDLAAASREDLELARGGAGPEGLRAGLAMFQRAAQGRQSELVGTERQPGALRTIRGEAGIESAEVGMGAEIAGTVMALRAAELRITHEFLPRALSLVSSVTRATMEILSAWRQGGLGGVLALFAGMSAGALGLGSETRQGAAESLRSTAQSLRESMPGAVGEFIGGALEDVAAGFSPAAAPGAAGAAPSGGRGAGASTGGGAPGTQPGGQDPLAAVSTHLRRAADRLDEYRRGGVGIPESDLETAGG